MRNLILVIGILLIFCNTGYAVSDNKNEIRGFSFSNCTIQPHKVCVRIKSSHAYGIWGSTQDFSLENPTIRIYGLSAGAPKEISGESGVLSFSEMDILVKNPSHGGREFLIKIQTGVIASI